MDLEERERFFAAGAATGRYDAPPGAPSGGMGPPGWQMLPQHPSEHAPPSYNDWPPSHEGRVSAREVLARQRQAEYKEQKALRERQREAALEQKRGRGAVRRDDPRSSHGGDSRSPGSVLDENNEQIPRPKGFRGLRDIHSDSDVKRRVAADEKKRAYAADLRRQIEDTNRRKQIAKQRSLEVDRHNIGMHNIITDMRGDGRLDGFDERGRSMGYSYADAHPPDAPRPYHPGRSRTGDDVANAHDTHPSDPRDLLDAPRGPGSGVGIVGPPGGHFADGVAVGARAEKLRRNQAYQRDLEVQIAEKAQRKAAEKAARKEEDSRAARAPGGAPGPRFPGPLGGAFACGREDVRPAEFEARNRARVELQHALRLQIEEKRLLKQKEKARREAEEAADQRRLAIERERLREAFEREQAVERAKAEERARLEEEAYRAAADTRRARELVDTPEPSTGGARAPEPRGDSADAEGASRGARFPPGNGPPVSAPPPPRGPTPSGARELDELRSELQREHRELMAANQPRNADVTIPQKRAETAERRFANARVEPAEPRETPADLGPALDAGAPFAALGSSANDLAGQLAKATGVGAPGAEKPSVERLVQRDGPDVDDDVGSIVGDSVFIFPGQTAERASFPRGSGRSVFSGPGAERPAPEMGPRRGNPRGEDPRDGGIGVAERSGGPERPLGGDACDDGPEVAGVSIRDADASRELDAAYRKNAARARALGVAPEATADEARGAEGGNASWGSDPDQLEDLLRNFLLANQGESGGASAFDAGDPSVETGAFDDPALGLNVEGAEDEDFGLGRPNTQMRMQTETRFVGSQE